MTFEGITNPSDGDSKEPESPSEAVIIQPPGANEFIYSEASSVFFSSEQRGAWRRGSGFELVGFTSDD